MPYTAATECEDARHEGLGTLSGAHDVVDVASHGAACRSIGLREFPVAEDRAENIVEVVRDTARESSHRLELARL